MKRFIIYGWLLLALALLMSGVALYIINYKPALLTSAIEQWIKLNSQRSLSVNGNIQLSFSPHAHLSLSQLSLSEYQQDDVFASIETMRLTVSLLPLLKGRFVVDHAHISGFQARIVRYQDGTVNIADLLQESGSGFFSGFEIGRIAVENSKLSFQDDMTRQSLDLEALQLSATQIATESLQQIKMQSGLVFRHWQSSDRSDSHTAQLKVRLEAEETVFDREKLASGPVFLSVQTLPEDRDTEGIEHISTHLTIASLRQIGNLLISPHVHMELGAQHNGYSVNAVLDTVVEVRTQGLAGTLTDLRLVVDFFHPDYLSKSVNGHLRGHLDFDGITELLRMDLQGQIDNSAVKTTIQVEDFTQQSHAFRVEIDRLDLTALLPDAQSESKTKASKNQPGDAAIPDFSKLEQLGLNGSIQIGQLSMGDIRLSDMQLMLRPENNNILIESSK
ncbi:MAG: AsmA family protein [Nitrosomonas sp.]|nr:AsmA family protein [Burkholderiales bacterium]MDR4520878.1 AsmA family protein [Nitrosomonas sp.]